MKRLPIFQLILGFLLTASASSFAQDAQENKKEASTVRGKIVQASAVSFVQDEDKEKEKEGITVRGKIVQGTTRETFHVDLSQITVRFLKRVELPAAPVPKNWNEMKPADKEAWWKKFLETAPGKKYVADRERLIKTADEYEAVVEDDGKFVIYDVSPGTYGLTARIDKEIGPRTYAFEVFGQIPVSEESDIIELGEKPLVITPIIRTGEPAAGWNAAETLAGGEVTLKSLRGKYVLINFWASDDPSNEFRKGLEEPISKLKAKHKFEILSVSLDREAAAAKKFVSENKLQGIHIHATRESRIARVFGVHTTPGLLLIDPEGIIKMTYPEMIRAFQAGKPSLDVVIDDRITGKDAPTLVTPEDGEKKEGEKPGQKSGG
jgi:peroxiredoxin